ncbi:hypothetical protein KEM55_001768, partial [Ascosphaera atra]
MGSDPQYAQFPDLSLAQHVFNLSNSYVPPKTRSSSIAALQSAIREHAMAPLYKHLAHPVEGILNGSGVARERSMSVQLERSGGDPARRMMSPAAASSAASSSPAGPVIVSNMLAPRKLGGLGHSQIKETTLPWDESLYKELEARNLEEFAKLSKEQEEAAESGGESDIQAVMGKRAEYLARIGTKIDILLAETRLGLFFGDRAFTKGVLERACTHVESGGDWDRRNRLKAYQGLHLVTVRNFAAAAPLLLDSLATFTSYELCTYSDLVVFAVIAGTLALKRVDFKSKVVDAPEIRAILGDGEERLSALTGGVSSGPGADEEMKDAPAADEKSSNERTIVNVTTLGAEVTTK